MVKNLKVRSLMSHSLRVPPVYKVEYTVFPSFLMKFKVTTKLELDSKFDLQKPLTLRRVPLQ